MTKQQTFVAIVTTLCESFNRTATDGLLEGYWMALSDLSEDEMKRACSRAMAESKFMPVPSELLEFAGRSQSRALDIIEAWEAVRRAIDRHDYTDSVDFGPLVNAVVRNLGGWQRLCDLGREQLDVWTRKEFERVYELLAVKDPLTLHGAHHRGALPGPVHQIQIGATKPQRQLEEQATDARRSVIEMIHDLADGKS